MTRLDNRFIEDRQLRDAARAVLADDIEHLRASLAEHGVAARVSSGVTATISSRIRNGARDAMAQARDQAGEHKGVMALLVGALFLFFSRGIILEWFEELTAAGEDEISDAEVPP
ncbi:MAG: hypothetical protein ACKO1N_13200, partial [Erythrobacter sp.]